MKKFLLATTLSLLTATQAFAWHSSLYGRIDDLETGLTQTNESQRAGIATVGSMAMLPKIDGAVSVAGSSYEGKKAMAIGYSKAFGENNEHFATIGASRGSEDTEMLGLGYSYKF